MLPRPLAFPFRIWLRLLERTRGCHEGRDRDAPQGRWDGIAYGIYGILWPRPNLKVTLMEVFLALVDLVWYCELVYLVLRCIELNTTSINISDWDLSGFPNPVWLVLITLIWLLDLADYVSGDGRLRGVHCNILLVQPEHVAPENGHGSANDSLSSPCSQLRTHSMGQ